MILSRWHDFHVITKDWSTYSIRILRQE